MVSCSKTYNPSVQTSDNIGQTLPERHYTKHLTTALQTVKIMNNEEGLWNHQRSEKTKEVYGNKMQCGILEGTLEQKKGIVEKLMKCK